MVRWGDFIRRQPISLFVILSLIWRRWLRKWIVKRSEWQLPKQFDGTSRGSAIRPNKSERTSWLTERGKIKTDCHSTPSFWFSWAGLRSVCVCVWTTLNRHTNHSTSHHIKSNHTHAKHLRWDRDTGHCRHWEENRARVNRSGYLWNDDVTWFSSSPPLCPLALSVFSIRFDSFFDFIDLNSNVNHLWTDFLFDFAWIWWKTFSIRIATTSN